MAPSLLALLLVGLAPGSLAADPAASALRYHVVHALHRVDAQSRAVEARAAVRADGLVQAMVRVPVTSFDSGNSNRDAHMAEVLEAGRLPHVVFRGVARLGPGLELPPAPWWMEGELELHGVRKPVRVPLAVERQPDGALRVTGSFEISLDAFGIERPSLLFVKVEDACKVELDLLMREVKP